MYGFVLAVLPWGAGPGRAQSVVVRVVDQDARRAVLEVEATWAFSLKASVDSARVVELTDRALQRLSGGQLHAWHTLALPALAEPRLAVVAADYEELNLAADTAGSRLLRAFVDAAPGADGLGLERKRPVVSLEVPLFSYQPASGVLRRYKRLTLTATFGAPRAAAKGQVLINPHLAVTESVLADGTVFKIPVTEAGVYRIDRAFLTALGLSPGSIEPDNLHVYGNGGAPVPALNSDARYADLVENATFVQGGGDGSFDAGDALIFYAAGPSGWRFDEETGAWAHYVHPYSNENYYFLKVGADAGQRVGNAAFPGIAGATVVNTVTGRYFSDIDDFIWSKEHGSGHTWVSNPIRSGGTMNVLQGLALPGLADGTATYEARVAIQSNPRATVDFLSGGTQLASVLAPGLVQPGAEFPAALPLTTTFTNQVTAGQPVDLSMRLQQQINEPQAALDWVRVVYPQRLQAVDGYLRFVTPVSITDQSFEFVLQGFSAEPQVWDVTEPHAVRRLGVQAGGGGFRIQLDASETGRPRELVAFVAGNARPLEAEPVAQVPNQNLHGIQSFPDLVIVTPAAFKASADDLAQHRRDDGLAVEVVVVDDLYNEFSGGLPDPRAMRDYFKFLYDRAPDEARLFRYALFFGDGHYNYRERGNREAALDNWVFPYETEESFVPDRSFTSDDYFGLLDDNEGAWEYRGFSSTTFERLDIGVGRLPVQSEAEAALVVEKIKRYESPETFGPWRSRYTFVADDGPTGLSGQQNDADLHMQNVDQVAELIRTGLQPRVDIKKIYAESFNREFQNGFRIPGAKREINSTLNEGTLLFNYSGHGGPDGFAQEEIFTTEDAAALQNKDRLAIFITATCSFGWWDLEEFQSGAETLLLNPNGGAVALMTTVRLVYTSGDTTSLNAGLNRALNIELFRPDADGLPRRLGDVMRNAKGTTVGLQGNSRKLNLLGDPSMRVGLPPFAAEVETINGVPLADQEARMRALDRVTLAGSVRNLNGQVDGSFDGRVNVTVFDAERRVSIKEKKFMPTPYYTVREDLIWRGEVKAEQGRFAATFVVPKDISYSDELGRVSVYVSGADGQALGYTERFSVGGTSDNPPDDADGPRITLFLNDTTFVSGGLTTPEPELIVKLFDQSGINTVGAGVGHEMLLVVNGDDGRAVDIGSGFSSDENSYQSGTVRWPLDEQRPGTNTLSVRAWDVLNNSSTTELTYYVTEQLDLALQNVYNYPNPTPGATRFVFEHNQPPGTQAQVQIRIFTLNGRLVRSIEPEEALPSGLLNSGPVQVLWDGRDEDFDLLNTGVYLYKVRVQIENNEGERQVAERIEKLAFIR